MRSLYLASVYLHILAAVVWLGGMLFLALVAVPGLRGLDAGLRRRLMSDLGVRFRRVGWWAIGLLVVTGVGNALGRWGWSSLTTRAFWASEVGRVLGLKLLVVTGMVALSVVHDFVLGPRATVLAQTGADEVTLERARRGASWLGRVNLLLGLAVVLLATWLVRGLP